jgi:hypothetical protein
VVGGEIEGRDYLERKGREGSSRVRSMLLITGFGCVASLGQN